MTNPEAAVESCVPAASSPPGRSDLSLTARVVRGGVWVFAGKVVGRGLQFVQLVVLARLLTPADFGLFGIVMLAIAVLETFSETGFNAALIQRKDNAEAYLDTAWTVQVIRRLVLAMVLFAGAPVVGWFFQEPRAVPLMRLMSLSVALSGFVNIGIIYFQKELQFHKQVVYDVLTAVVSLIVGVVLAYKLRSVWALIWAGLAGTAAQCALSYCLHSYRPHPRLDRAQAAELFRFGRWMLGSSIVVFVALHGDSAFLGKMLGATALGVYQMAYRIGNLAATEIAYLTNTVMMPAYAKVQDDRARLGRAFLQVFEVVMSLALPLTVFIVLAAPEIVLGVLGSRWQAAIVPIEILAVAGLLRAIAATGGPVFVGTGRPRMSFSLQVVRVSVFAISIYPLTKLFGVAGTCCSIVCGIAATLPVWTRVTGLTGVTWGDLLRRCRLAFLLAALTAVGVCLGETLSADLPLVTLVWEAVIAGAFCIIGALVCARLSAMGLNALTSLPWRVFRGN